MSEYLKKLNSIDLKAWWLLLKSASEFIRVLISIVCLITTVHLATPTEAHSPANLPQTFKGSVKKVFVAADVEFTSSNLPIIVIDTYGQEIPDEPKITAHMGIIYNGEGILNYYPGNFNHYDGFIGIETRGSSAQSFPKKSYAVETRDAQSNNLDVSILGFPAENDWVLYGPYSDKSLIRNILAYRLSNDIGRYASRTKCCELIMNGEYRGLYVWMEKIKRDKNRVNISKILPTDLTGDALTGGYIIKIDKPAGAQLDGWESAFLPYPDAWQRIFYQYHYPDQDDIVPEQKAYIQNYVYSFESLMNRSNYSDAETGYSKYIDVDSFVDFFILSEIAKNVDAYRLITFFYKDRDSKNGRLFIGPIWDFNLAFGNADYYGGWFVTGWQVDFLEKDDFWQNPFWWQKLMADSSFTNKIHQRWDDLRQNLFTVQRIYAIIDSLVLHLNEAQQRNFERWPILNEYVWPNAFVGGNYPAEIRYLKQWVQSRMLWMDVRMPGQSTSISIIERPAPPFSFRLKQNYPNPFNASTRIDYQLSAPTHVRLVLYDVLGRIVAVLADGMQPAGNYATAWNGADANGQPLADGVYILRLESGEHSASIKLALVK